MRTNQRVFEKYEIPLFLFLTYALSWWSAPLTKGQIIPYGPALAAILVLALTAGRTGLRELWQRVIRWRIPVQWFLVGPAIILGYHAAGFIASLLLGLKPAGPPYISEGTVLELLLLGGLWEEPGWTGYLLPKMQERFAGRFNPLFLAALVTGLFRSIWHLPLFLYGNIPWIDVFILNIAFQLIIAWIFYRSGRSVLAVMLFHLTSNLMGMFTYPLFTGAAHTIYTVLFVTGAWVAAGIILLNGGLVEQPSSATAQVPA